MEMKIKRQVKFSEALDEITRYVESLRSGSVEFNDRALRANDDVELELEFEVKWKGALETAGDGSGAIIPQEEVWEAEKGDHAKTAGGVPSA